MKNKRPWYKSGFVIGLLIIGIGMVVGITASDTKQGAEIATMGTVVLIATSIKRVLGLAIRAIKPKPKIESQEPLQPTAIQEPPVQVPVSPPITASVATPPPVPVSAPAPNPKPAPASVLRKHKTENHKVAGVSFRQKEIQSIGTRNSYYDFSESKFKEIVEPWERVYQYEFDLVVAELVPEEHNAATGNYAIKVMADNVHIGYIKSGSVSHVRKLIENDDILDVDIEIKGGKSKMLDEDGDIQRDSIGYYAKVTLTLYDYENE